MPFVIGTYRDKIAVSHSLLGTDAESLRDCNRAIAWQLQGWEHAHQCTAPAAGEHDYRTAWHICDPAPDSPLSMVCRECGEELHVTRGALTWEAFHAAARAIWGEAIPLTVAELRLSMPGEI